MAAEFIAEEGVLKGLILSLEKGEEWTIGRDPDVCTLVIEDPKASRLQARVRKIEAGYLIENLSETQPITMGGSPLTAPTLLHDRDTLMIGSSLFRFYEKGAPPDVVFEAEYPYGEEEEAEKFSEEQSEEEKVSEPLAEKGPESAEESFDEQDLPQEEAPKFEEHEPVEEELHEEVFFEEPEEVHIDLTQTTRFLIKVISGPNTGAEFALDFDRSYLLGTDTASCDIVFNDLSVSREHARLNVDKEGRVIVTDLNSRNGVFVDKERVVGSRVLIANAVVSLGTSAFLLIDREAPSETIVTPLFEAPEGVEEEGIAQEEEREKPTPVAAAVPPRKAHFSPGSLVLALIICGLAVLLGIGVVSLLQTKEVEMPQKDQIADLQGIIKNYPAIRFTYNQGSGKLFLMGHVKTGVEHNELLYQLRGLGFITSIDDNVVNDEAVWQEMNILLSKHPDFKGVSMHAPEAGVFVVNGYLQTEKQAADLTDYLNVHFNYISLLQNRVIVEQSVVDEVRSRLNQAGFEAVNGTINNGELVLTGYISSNDSLGLESLIENAKKMSGIRSVRNLVVAIPPEEGVIDLNKKYQKSGISKLRYRVTGYSKHGDVNVNVVINGRILSRGDCLDGYTVTGIQPHAVFLEKDGLQYKIEYNTCKSFGVEE